MKLKLTSEKLNPFTAMLSTCTEFFNRSGEYIYEQNKAGTLGSETTQQAAKNTPFNTWLLEMILSDCQTVIEGKPQYITGKGGSHVWLSDAETKERLIIITVQP